MKTRREWEAITSYKRFENETDEELIYRITGDKDKIGSWQEVANILNELLGTEYTESKFRKQRQAFDKMLNANRDKFVSSDEQVKEIENKLEELRKERIKLQTANIERGRIDRAESRQEMYYQYIGSICETLPLPEFKPINETYFEDDDFVEEYLMAISDVHYGATFISENNEYSPEIVRERFEYLLDESICFIDKHNIKTFKIVSLGDMLQGCIRVSDLKLNDSSVVKATVEISRLIANFINQLSAYANIEYYHCPTANHTQLRFLGTKASELADEDLEYVIGNYIKDLCRNNDRVKVCLAQEGKQYIDIPIVGHEVIAMHGHQIKNIENSIRDLSIVKRTFLDYVLLGHYHNGKEIPAYEGVCNDCEVLISPSFIGSDPYSDSLMKGGKSSVKIYGFNSVFGHNETYKFILN